MDAAKRIALIKAQSVKVIKEGQASTGAYIAGPTFEAYKFSWFRDGSFIADAMSRVGEVESAERFFDWGAGVILQQKEKLASGGILHARYTVDGLESTEEWPNYQLDGFGTFLWAICQHAKRHGRSTAPWDEAIETTLEYLTKRWHEPNHDWWEEYAAVHAATLASVYAGLAAFGRPEAKEVQQAIDVHTARLDASLIACATPFKAVAYDDFAPVLHEIEEKLVSEGGGVHRHLTDVYYGGGEWILLTALLGWHYATLGRKEDAIRKLERIAAQVDDNGWLPEQSLEYMLAPEHYDRWVGKWGPSARPLLWSHAMFLTLASELEL